MKTPISRKWAQNTHFAGVYSVIGDSVLDTRQQLLKPNIEDLYRW